MNALSSNGAIELAEGAVENATNAEVGAMHVDEAIGLSNVINTEHHMRAAKMNMLRTNLSIKKGIREHLQMSIGDVIKEFTTLFWDKTVLKPMKAHQLSDTQRKRLPRSHMF